MKHRTTTQLNTRFYMKEKYDIPNPTPEWIVDGYIRLSKYNKTQLRLYLKFLLWLQEQERRKRET